MHFTTSNTLWVAGGITSIARAPNTFQLFSCVEIRKGRLDVALARGESNNSDSLPLSLPATVCVVVLAWT
jgi:hypothetical protein